MSAGLGNIVSNTGRTSGGGGGLATASEGVQAFGADVQLGSTALGDAASQLTNNRWILAGGFAVAFTSDAVPSEQASISPNTILISCNNGTTPRFIATNGATGSNSTLNQSELLITSLSGLDGQPFVYLDYSTVSGDYALFAPQQTQIGGPDTGFRFWITPSVDGIASATAFDNIVTTVNSGVRSYWMVDTDTNKAFTITKYYDSNVSAGNGGGVDLNLSNNAVSGAAMRFSVDATAGQLQFLVNGDLTAKVEALKVTLGDPTSAANDTRLTVDDPGKAVYASKGAGDYQLYLDFNARLSVLGDYTQTHNGTEFYVFDLINSIRGRVDGEFAIQTTGGDRFLYTYTPGRSTQIGDVDNSFNQFIFEVNDSTQVVQLTKASNVFFLLDTVNKIYGLGDSDSTNKGTYFLVNDNTAQIYLNAQDAAGAVFLNSPGGLTISGDSVFLHTQSGWGNGAGAAAGTLGNAPAAGNPTKWLPIDDNGTTRYIPAW